METIIGALIGAAITGGIGIWQIILTRKSLENTNRPYVLIYNEVVHIEKVMEYLVIKNTGNVPAKIENIMYDEAKLQLMNYIVKNDKGEYERTIHVNNIINHFKHSTLAPNQSYRIPISNSNTRFEDLTFTIIYKGVNSKKYKETIFLNLKQDLEMNFLKANGDTTIEDTLQEIFKKM